MRNKNKELNFWVSYTAWGSTIMAFMGDVILADMWYASSLFPAIFASAITLIMCFRKF